jgi:membrane-anchored mycosin MYCP
MPSNAFARVTPVLVAATAVAVAGLAAPAAAAPPGLRQQCAAPAKVVVRQIPWPQQRLAPERAWVLTRGEHVTVAVIDSGVDATVPQLRGHVLPGIDVIGGRGRANTDCIGRGTFVAGIIAARPTPGIGFAGVAPGATILPLRQTSTGQDGSPSVLAAAIRAATDHHAKVINISDGSPVSTTALRSAVRYAQAHDVLIVAAADDQNRQGASYPAVYPGVLAVGAIGEDGKRSQSGNAVRLVAPGDGVLGLGAGGPGHLIGQGAGFAAPFVAGVAALVRSYQPALTAAQVARRLELTADHPGGSLPDPVIGFGVVNPYAAVASILPEEGARPATPSGAPPQASLLPVVHAAPVDHGGRTAGLAIGGLGLAALLITGLLAAVLPRGRRRGWRAGTVPASAVPGGTASRGSAAPGGGS